MNDYDKLKAKLNFMLQNQIELEKEHGEHARWNRGYKEAIKDILDYLENNND